MIFCIPPRAAAALFGDAPPGPLAYVEWFSPPSLEDRELNARMYHVSRSYKGGVRRPGVARDRSAAIVEIDTLIRSCHLAPKFTRLADRSWTTDNVLERADSFIVNNYRDHHAFQTIY